MQEILLRSPLFAGITPDDLTAMLACLRARRVGYPRDAAILMAGDPARDIGVVVSGRAQVERDDAFGNRAILTDLNPGDMFAEAFVCAGVKEMPLSVIAAEACEVLWIDYGRVISTCTSGCAFHEALIRNMLSILAGKNILLNGKIEALSARTTRDKLLTYLSAQARRAGGGTFAIPFSRQELADYLAVDRSALSREIGAMAREGLIRCDRNRFELPREK